LTQHVSAVKDILRDFLSGVGIAEQDQLMNPGKEEELKESVRGVMEKLKLKGAEGMGI
jgi:hypothetical protein